MTSGVHYQVATPAQTTQITKLWQTVFGDTPEFIERNLRKFVGADNAFVALENGKVVAQLMAVPCTAARYHGVYLYALATNPAQQKNGVMSALMDVAELAKAKQGAQFAVLIPAGEALYHFYRKRGYEHEVNLRSFDLNVSLAHAPSADFSPITGEYLAEMRQKYMPGMYVDFIPLRYEEILRDFFEEGGGSATTAQGYALYKIAATGELLIAELGATDTNAAIDIVNALGHKWGAAKTRITLPAQSPLFNGRGVTVPAGLYKMLDQSLQLETLYYRLGFDELH